MRKACAAAYGIGDEACAAAYGIGDEACAAAYGIGDEACAAAYGIGDEASRYGARRVADDPDAAVILVLSSGVTP